MIIGNESIQKLISNSIYDSKINVISGPSYIGKRSYITKLVGDICNEDDIFIVDGSMTSVRDSVEFSLVKPSFGKFRIILIDNVESLSEPAQDVYLKLFENPHDHLLVYMITEDFDILLPALKSRIKTIFRWKKLNDVEMNVFVDNNESNRDDEAKKLCFGRPGFYNLISANSDIKSFYNESLKLFKGEIDPITSPIPTVLNDLKDSKRDAVCNIISLVSHELIKENVNLQKISGLCQFSSVLKRNPSANAEIYWNKLILTCLV